MASKKLIEVALPLDKINEACAREKSIRHGHPSTLHLWWARRPLAAARAVIWASLVDDPASHPELFPTEEEQHKERERLFGILEDLVIWENSNNQDVLTAAKKEILKYNHGEFPTLLDPFAGGGAIPLEAQRLGLKAIAHDLNPVAVMINKAMIEIPPQFINMRPINPEARNLLINTNWSKAQGLAEDVRYYAKILKQETFKRVGHLYPNVKVPSEYGGGEATVIAWLWARTCECTNPVCKKEIPLIRNFNISKKKRNEAHVECKIHKKKIFTVKEGLSKVEGTINRMGARCIYCNSVVKLSDIREQGKNKKIGNRLIAIVAEGKKGRLFISPDDFQSEVASSIKRPKVELGDLAHYPGYINPPAYGYKTISSLFTNRQLNMLVEMCDALSQVKETIQNDIKKVKSEEAYLPYNLLEYEHAILTYLAFMIDQVADHSSSICSWNAPNTQMRSTFGMTGMSMAWDFAECNVFSNSTGSFDNLLNRMVKGIATLGEGPKEIAEQYDAQKDLSVRNVLVSTDPPYYSNVPYADFSDFFYVWLRKNLKELYPDLFATLLTPKKEELVADPYRDKRGKNGAKTFFEDGMYNAFVNIYNCSSESYPVTIYYAFKQKEISKKNGKDTTLSTGWEVILSAIIRAGFSVTGTWPLRTEKQGRVVGNGQNALASSIVLVCRKRPENAPQTTRRILIAQLRRELHPALKKLQESNIAPVDLAQAAIGPGMGVFSRYSSVLEADGSKMTVRSALQVINEQVDAYFNEQVGSLDTESRFCVDLYLQNAYEDIPFGEAEILATAKAAHIPNMVNHGVLYAKAGKVHLVKRENLPETVLLDETNIWLLTQQLTYAMETGGIEQCAKQAASLYGSNAEHAKDLAYRLYTVAEQKGWTSEAFAYNALVVSWPDIQSRAAELKAQQPEQMDLF
jgi:putative DNA methylase